MPTPPPSAGGPDPFGYQYRDDRHPDGARFAWLDVASNATRLTTLDNADDVRAGPVALPFGFLFYGQSYNAIYVDTNGLLSFVGPPWLAPHRNVC